MSYLVLARKWRPQTFRDLIGQEHVSQTLQNAIQTGRVAHAFLFTGARGVGKTSAARILAKALTCDHGPAVEPCNTCPACDEVTSGIAVDVIEIDGASNTGVDDVRELRENVKYLPSRLRLKIFIIDEVHMLSTNAFNALLKTLEEPPAHVKFIFATTEPHKVPITILSRCQRFDFKRIPLPTVISRLRTIVDQEGVNISDTALAMVARKGDGSMRDSLSTLDQVLAFCGTTVSDDDTSTLLGVVDRRLLLAASESVFARDSRAALNIVKRVDASGYNIRQFCHELIEHFRALTLCKALGDISELTDLAESELSEIRAQAKGVELPDLQRHVAILLKADSDMPQSAFPRLVLEMSLLKMAMLAPSMPIQDIISRIDGIRGLLPAQTVSSSQPVWERPTAGPQQQGHAAPVTAPLSTPSTPKRETVKTSIPQVLPEPAAATATWPDFVALVRREKPMIGSLLEHARPLNVSGDLVELGFHPGSFEFTALNSPTTLTDLESLAKAHFGRNATIKLKTVAASSESAPPTLAEKKCRDDAEQLSKVRESAQSDSAVQAALEVFGGALSKIEPLKG